MKRHCRGEHEEAHADMDTVTKEKDTAGRIKQSRHYGSDKGNSSEQRTAFWTLILSVSTVFLTVFTGLVFAYAVKQSHDVERSIGIARQTMVGDQRPWIGGPETSYKDGRATFVFSNTGKTPATNIAINGGLVGNENWSTVINELCAKTDRHQGMDNGFGTISITPNGRYVLHDLGPDKPFSAPDLLPRLLGHGYVVGCAIYSIPFDDKRHRTGFSIPIDKAEGGSISFGETSTLFPD